MRRHQQRLLLLAVAAASLGAASAFLVAPSAPRSAAALVPFGTRRSAPGSSSSSRLQARQPSSNQRGGGGRRGAPVEKDLPVMNEDITAATVRVVAPNPGGKDEALGVMSRGEALRIARDRGDLDLILINPNSDPPVCKIVDYSKFRYSQEKKAKEQRKNSKAVEVKEVKMSYKIDVHDYDVRRKNAKKFLQQGNRVKCTVMFRGREVQHDALGFELLNKLAADLEDTCLKEGRPKREGRNLSLILGPRPEVLKAINENRKREQALKRKEKQASLQQKQSGGPGNTASTEAEEDEDFDDDDEYDDEDDDDEEVDLDDLLKSDDLTDALFG